MASIRDNHNVWRDNLVPASFRGAVFHVETSARASGRRTVVHEYPKRNSPYAEDMGRSAIRWQISGYNILRDKGIRGNLLTQISDMINALEADGPGVLIHPTLGEMLVQCERYSYSDKRTAGGYVEYDMQFVEAGSGILTAIVNTVGLLTASSSAAETSAASNIKQTTAPLQDKPKTPATVGA